ncbi:helix-turn-helix domain-containing protein [Thermus sp.]|uniref:helix-turn-helix domain-containing protein n=1 Tax=Thermus sp. TaxID=275 RepID=UPI00307E0485
MRGLRELRGMVGMTIAELARATGLSRSYLWRLERGERKPGVKAVFPIMRVFSERLGIPETAVLEILMGKRVAEAFAYKPPSGREPAPRYLTVDQAARYLGVSRSYIKNAVRSGLLRPRLVPGPRGQTVFSIEELQSFAKRYLENAEVAVE